MAFFQADTLWINQLADGVGELVLDVPDARVNVLNERVFTDLDAALDHLATVSAFKLLIIRSGKAGSFCAGADLRDFNDERPAAHYVALSERGQCLFNRIAELPTPTVAVIAGSCLGGGLELALACDYRVVVDRPETRLGLPEIELGLIPGWGGTQRLPRVVGLERALRIILGGRRLNAAEALRWGLADELVRDSDAPPAFLDEPVKRPRTRLPYSTWRQRLLESTGLGRSLIVRGARRLLKRRLADDMPAPWEALQAVEVGIRDGMAAGLAHERQAIGLLVATPACRNLARLFRLREQARKVPERQENGAAIRRIAVVGCGTMGAGIAQLAVLKGHEVVVREADDMALGLAMLRLMGLLQLAVSRGVLPAADLQRRLAQIHGTTAWKGFDQVDLVIEAIVEDRDAKHGLFREMEGHVRDSTVLASNTSSLRIGDLQQGMRHPGRLVGLHFFNPVHKMPLVEVVAGPETDDSVPLPVMHWVRALGKTPILVKDSPGFLVNRILMPYLNEAVQLLSEGVDIDLVDRTMHRFGMPAGPLEVLDQVGLDVAAHIARGIEPAFADRLSVHPAFAALADKGQLGQKSGIGFYRYRGKHRRVNGAAQSLVRAIGERQGTPFLGPLTGSERAATIRDRLIGVMIIEAYRCLEERLVADADTLDLAMVLGSGWAPHRGGPLRYARDRGLAEMMRLLTDLAERFGPRFQPPEGLQI